MLELPQKKVGIISCSGEDMPEGTVSRLAALRVLEELRPGETVTICLPLFLAGGEGDRAFAKFYPTIAIDGCEKRCSFRGTEQYSNKPAAGIVVTDVIASQEAGDFKRSFASNAAGKQAVEMTAELIAQKVDELLGKAWNRREGSFAEEPANEEKVATCSCGSGIPVQSISFNGAEVTVVALPLIFDNFYQAGKFAGDDLPQELMEMVKVYNPVDSVQETALQSAIMEAYREYRQRQGGHA